MELHDDLDDFFDPDLTLTIAGHTYRIKSPDAESGLRIRRFFTDPTALGKLSDDDYLREVATILGAEWIPDIHTEEYFKPEPVLDKDKKPVIVDGKPKLQPVKATREVDRGEYRGGVWSEMFDNGVRWVQVMRAGQTALLYTGLGEAQAVAYWTGGKGPKVPQPNREQRRAAEKTSPKESGASTAGTIRGRARTTKKTPAAENQTQ